MKDNISCPPTVMFKGADLNNTWALAVYITSKEGMILPASPNYTGNPDHEILLTKDICATIEYTGKALTDIKNREIHKYYPHHAGYKNYENQLRIDTPEFEHSKTFHYAYVLRLRRYPICEEFKWDNVCEAGGVRCPHYNNGKFTDGHCYIDQLKFIAENLDAFNKRLQAITWISKEDLPASTMDEDKKSVPCLQRIQIRNLGNGFYEIWLNWRSRDLFKAYIWNLLGLINTIDELIQESREKLGLEPLTLVKVVDHISSLHIYETEWNDAKKVPVDLTLLRKSVFM